MFKQGFSGYVGPREKQNFAKMSRYLAVLVINVNNKKCQNVKVISSSSHKRKKCQNGKVFGSSSHKHRKLHIPLASLTLCLYKL